MSSAAELPHFELSQLPNDLREVIVEIGEDIPHGSWTIEQVARTDMSRTSPFFELAMELRGRQGVIDRLLNGEKHASLEIITPNTMVVGLYLRNQRQVHTNKYGMFSSLSSERYSPSHVVEVLNGSSNEVPNHSPIDLMKVTGRQRGTISPIIGREYLEKFTAIEFSIELTNQISAPNIAVAYPLGGKDLLYYVARGSDFISAYAGLLARANVKNNLARTSSRRR